MSEPGSISSDPIAYALDNPVAAPDLAEPGDARAARGGDTFERPPFPLGCPVRPLGLSADVTGSQKCYYLDVNGQLVGLEAGNKHGVNALIALFGTQSDWIESHFPRWSKPITEYDRSTKTHTIVKPSEIVGFDQGQASRALIEECTRRGIFDPGGRMRGRGAHPLPGGGLIVHFGDTLLASRMKVTGGIKTFGYAEPGLYERFVYPAGEALPRPWHEPSAARPAERLLALLQTWHWKRPLLDARFVLGGIGASLIGGALRWRPNMWITGGAGTGKSTLNGEDGVLDQLFGAGVLRTGNASAAAIRQILKNSTVPVLFDEIEASEDNRRVREVVELARVSSSGATMHRGGADHVAHEFTLRSCFWFGSINIPPIEPQDRSRLAILELKPFAPGAVPPVLAKYNLPDIGQHLLRRMIDGFPRLEATIARYAEALSMGGHTRRACDQFGTLLACADLLINDWDATSDGLPDDEEVALWAGHCAPDKMAEISDATSDHVACLNRLATHLVQARGGEDPEVFGTWIGRAVNAAALPLLNDEPGYDKSGSRLQQHGLKIVNPTWYGEERSLDGTVTRKARWGAAEFAPTLPGYLAIAATHQGLDAAFRGTKWQAGVWRQSLARFDGAIDTVKVKFGRQSLTAVLVPLAALLDESELPDASQPGAVTAWRAALAAMPGGESAA